MSQMEFEQWLLFYRHFPYDDRHRFYRPAALVATSLGGGGQDGLNDRLEFLQPQQKTYREDLGDLTPSDLDLYKALGIKL